MHNGHVIDVLNDLIETCKDSERGFNACARQADSPELKSLFAVHAAECGHAASELQTQVIQCGGRPVDHGSTTGALHRSWVALRSSVSSHDDKAVLEECVRGEDAALDRFREALEEPLPPEVRGLVERQLQGVQRNHDQIKALRNRISA